MSVYADYDYLSKGYDESRIPQGVHHYLGIVYSHTMKTAEKLHLLDAGCGTGNYSKYLMDHGLGRATLFDANTGMIEKARDKMKVYIEKGSAKLEQHMLPDIPYEDNSFDVVMINQVLHHLCSTNDPEFTKIGKTLQECYRVLKPNGVIIINMCTPYQIKNCFWFSTIFPKAFGDILHRLVEPTKFLAMLRRAGFVSEKMLVDPLEIVASDDWYFREDGPLHLSWREATSVTAAGVDDISKIEKTINELKAEGKLSDFVRKNDALRPVAGQFSIVSAKKL